MPIAPRAPSAWGYPFDVQTRWSFYPAGSPNVVVTSFAVQGLLEGAAAADQPHLRARAVAAARWVLEDLWVERGGFFAYHPDRDGEHPQRQSPRRGVRAPRRSATTRWRAIAYARAVERTLAAQAPDGGFPYGDGAGSSGATRFTPASCCAA